MNKKQVQAIENKIEKTDIILEDLYGQLNDICSSGKRYIKNTSLYTTQYIDINRKIKRVETYIDLLEKKLDPNY